MPIRVSRRASTLIAVVLSVLALGAAAPAAHAGLLNLLGAHCGAQQLTQPFTPWADPDAYFLVDGGAFEPGNTSWSTAGGATTGAGNEPWHVTSSADANSLSLPPGSSATSPPACVSLESPTLRFFARGSGGSPGSALGVEVLFQNTAGLLDSLPIGSVSASGEWQPTPPYVFVVNTLSILGGGYRAVAFRFTPHGDATWQIDDVYVDPWSKG